MPLFLRSQLRSLPLHRVKRLAVREPPEGREDDPGLREGLNFARGDSDPWEPRGTQGAETSRRPRRTDPRLFTTSLPGWKPSEARRRGYCADSGSGGVWARLFRWTVSGRPRRPGLEAQTADAREVTALAVAAGETGDLRRTGTPGEDALGRVCSRAARARGDRGQPPLLGLTVGPKPRPSP